MRPFVRARPVAVALAVAAALGGVAFLVATRGDEGGSAIGVGVGPRGAAAADGAVWIANADSNSVSRINERARGVTATTDVGNAPFGVTVAQGAVWVANARSDTVSRIDPLTGKV